MREAFGLKQQDASRAEVVKVGEYVGRRFVLGFVGSAGFSIEPSAPKKNGY